MMDTMVSILSEILSVPNRHHSFFFSPPTGRTGYISLPGPVPL